MKKFRLKNTLIFIAVIALLIFLHFLHILRPIENAIIFVLEPFTSSIYNVSSDIRGVYERAANKEDLFSELEQLQEEIQRLTAENASLKKLENENKVLRDHLQFLTNNKYNYVLANIISQGSLSGAEIGERSIIIDKGGNDGLSAGLVVVDSQGIVVGKIINIKDSISEVALSTDSRCKIAATVQNNDYTIGVTRGDLGLTIKMDFVPQTEVININDNVVTSGLERNIPSGLLIGKIIQVEKESNEVWQKGVIEPLIDLNNLTFVSVLLP